MTHISLAIDPATNDLFLDQSGNLAIVEGAKAVGQHARQRLLTYEGEWFLDTETGLPWMDDLLGRGYDPALAEAIVKAVISETDGVTDITSFAVAFDRSKRGLEIREITVRTTYDGEVAL